MKSISDFYRDPAPAPKRWLPPASLLTKPRFPVLGLAMMLVFVGVGLGLRARPPETRRVSMIERVEFVESYEREHGCYPAAVAGVRYETDCAPQNGVCRGHASHRAHLSAGIDDVVLRPR